VRRAFAITASGIYFLKPVGDHFAIAHQASAGSVAHDLIPITKPTTIGLSITPDEKYAFFIVQLTYFGEHHGCRQLQVSSANWAAAILLATEGCWSQGRRSSGGRDYLLIASGMKLPSKRLYGLSALPFTLPARPPPAEMGDSGSALFAGKAKARQLEPSGPRASL
jgi:hypothetical protein